MITKDYLEMIGEAALKYGIKNMSMNDDGVLAIEFSGLKPQLVFSSMSENIQHIGEAHGMPTDDQMLFASSIPMTDDEIAARPPR